MLFRQITPSVYEIPLGHVNAFLINHDELTLIDTGLEGNAHKLMRAIEQIGRTASDIRHIIVTHCHSDHTGSLAAIQKACNATTYMHPIDAALVRQGNAMRPVTPAPGLINKALYRTLIVNAPKQITPAQIDREVEDGTTLEIAGGIEAIHTPGHCAGQLALFWPQEGGVLFAADTASNMVQITTQHCLRRLRNRTAQSSETNGSSF